MTTTERQRDSLRSFPSRCGCIRWEYCVTGDEKVDAELRALCPPLIHDHRCLLLHPHNQAPAVQKWLKHET